MGNLYTRKRKKDHDLDNLTRPSVMQQKLGDNFLFIFNHSRVGHETKWSELSKRACKLSNLYAYEYIIKPVTLQN